MTHPRTTLRDAFAAAVTGLALTGSRVHKVRKYPLTELPALRIYTDADSPLDVDLQDEVTPTTRLVTIICEAVAQATGEVEDTVDAICEQVEAALNAAPTLSGGCVSMVYTGYEGDFDATGEQPVVVGRMTFQAVVAG